MERMKRIVTVQDLSCVGKCSLTVALPIISAMGVEASVLPTAVLSSHTLFPHPSVCDLTAEIPRITSHWRDIGVTFDGIYTGYLGSMEQLDLISRFIDDFGGGFVFIDPVMGDHGHLYARFTPDFVGRMAALCAKADVIVPNLTEACLLLNRPYIGETYAEETLSPASVSRPTGWVRWLMTARPAPMCPPSGNVCRAASTEPATSLPRSVWER